MSGAALIADCQRLAGEWPHLFHFVFEAQLLDDEWPGPADEWPGGPAEFTRLVKTGLPRGIGGYPVRSDKLDLPRYPRPGSIFVHAPATSGDEGKAYALAVDAFDTLAQEIVCELSLIPIEMPSPFYNVQAAQVVQTFADGSAHTTSFLNRWDTTACWLGHMYAALAPSDESVVFLETENGEFVNPRRFRVRGLPYNVFRSAAITLERMGELTAWSREPFPRWTFIRCTPRAHYLLLPQEPQDATGTPSDLVSLKDVAWLMGLALKTLQNRKSSNPCAPPIEKGQGSRPDKFSYVRLLPWLRENWPEPSKSLPATYEEAREMPRKRGGEQS